MSRSMDSAIDYGGVWDAKISQMQNKRRSPVPAVLFENTIPSHSWLTRIPFDVLVLIFKIVFDSLHPSYLPNLEDPFDPSLFPEAFAAVSPLWRDALCCVSEFWTRIIIAVDVPTPLSTVERYLKLSGSHPLDILIDREFEAPDVDPSESHAVQAYMRLLYPHMHRWRSLKIHVLHSASLPRFGVDVHGEADRLIDLRLGYEDLSGDQRQPETMMPFRAQLTGSHVELDGHAFQALCLPMPTVILTSAIHSLHISGPNRASCNFSIYDLVQSIAILPNLCILHLRAIHKRPGDDAPVAQRLLLDTLDEVRFRDMDGADIVEFVRHATLWYLSHICFIHCTLPASDAFDYNAAWIDFVDSDLRGMCTLLGRQREVNQLGFYSCAGLDAALLDEMAHTVAPELGHRAFASIEALRIRECGTFTSGDVRRMLEVQVQEPMQEIDVSGHGEIDDGDREWFRQFCEERVRWGSWEDGDATISDGCQ